MPRRKRRTASYRPASKLSTEQYRRSLLAKAYALILAPDWEQFVKRQFMPAREVPSNGSCAESTEEAEAGE